MDYGLRNCEQNKLALPKPHTDFLKHTLVSATVELICGIQLAFYLMPEPLNLLFDLAGYIADCPHTPTQQSCKSVFLFKKKISVL